jgi:hypothetical protein
MARIRVCGVCMKPVRECICDDEDQEPGGPQDGSERGRRGVSERVRRLIRRLRGPVLPCPV